MASHPRPVMDASAIDPQNSSIMLSPVFKSHVHFPGTGDQGKDKYPETMFLFFINLLASVYNFIRKIVQIITDLLRMFTELGTYLHGKLVQAGTNVKG